MQGIVTKAIGGFFFVADNRQEIYQARIRGKIKTRIYPGDSVEYLNGMIEEIYPRRNLLYRPSIANVDQVLIVLSLTEPEMDRKLLDRFLIMVESVEMSPLIIINKIDLSPERELTLEFKDYITAGYQVYFISAKKGSGLEKLLTGLYKKVNVLTGPSGVGKSSLINHLITGINMPVGQISPRLKRGVHTTRHVELLPVNRGGWIADTPGFSILDINYIARDELGYLFPEFNGYLENCKFRRCSHTHEPGCAVKKAVGEGMISSSRYKSYQLFYQELLNKE
jgi:ribosome biogenesis GTPase / thiamine phosphate phosphatase